MSAPAAPDAVPPELAQWTAQVVAALDLAEADTPDAAVLLDLTRQVAHEVTRTAGPLTCYLIGLATARRGGGAADLSQVVAEVRALVEQR